MTEKTPNRFRAAYDPVEVEQSGKDLSNPYRSEYLLKEDDDGNPVLVETGRRCVYDEIQAARTGTELKEAIKRFGVESVATLANSERLPDDRFGDQTSAPSSLMEAYQMADQAAENASAAWNKLPGDLREKYKTQAALMKALDDGSLLQDLAAYDAANKQKGDDQ